MQKLQFPSYSFRFKNSENKIAIFDEIRKKFILLTPEEWVRQHVIHFLLSYSEVPIGLINTEVGMKINKLKRRSDVVVFGADTSVLLLVECKAPEVPINEKVLHQAAQYNSHIKARYIWLTNGLDHHLYHINHQTGEIARLEEIPKYKEL